MTDDQQAQADAQEQAAFERSFAEAAGLPAPAEPEVQAESGTAAKASDAAQVDSEPATDLQASAQSAEVQPGEQAEDDPVVFDGYKRSEMKRLLESAAEVGSLKRQLDKAHGHIGDLNRRFQQVQPAQQTQAPAPAMAATPEQQEKLKQFEEDYPEVAEYMRAMGLRPQTAQQVPPLVQPEVQAVATASPAPVQAEVDPLAIELAVMDHTHQGWREKIQSREFSLWLTAQDANLQQAYHSAVKASDMSTVLTRYDQWANARQAATDRVQRGQQRLQRATTPTGNGPRPQASVSETEAMEAAFKRTLGH